jgi:alpha-amylase
VTDICLGFEVHQPFRIRSNFFWDHMQFQPVPKGGLVEYYFDHSLNREVFNRAASKCYLPSNRILLEQIDSYKRSSKKVKVTFSLSGVFLEQCEMWNKDVLDSFRQLADTQCVEFLDQTYYHSLSSLWPDKDEWFEQIKIHRKSMKDLIGVEPTFFENTEFLYNNSIAKAVENLGYRGIFTEGVDKVLGWRSPNYVYKPKGCERIRVLMRNYKLTDDFGFRFSSRWWEEFPLTADKYSWWLASTPGQCINLFADYETFGEHHWPESGIHEFLRYLPQEILKRENLRLATPTEIVDNHEPVGEVDVSEFNSISWADIERNTSCWLGNTMQWAFYRSIIELAPLVKESEDDELIRVWRYLQMSDHLYYIFTAGGGPGEVHSYFSPYGSPYNAFVTCLSVISDFEARVRERIIAASFPLDFYDGHSIRSIWSLKGLIIAVERSDLKQLESHLKEGDIREWVEDSLQEHDLARELDKLREYQGENLRRNLYEVMIKRYGELSRYQRLGIRPRRVIIREFAMTPDNARHILRRLPSWRAFWFNRSIGDYTGYHAVDLSEFCDKIKSVDIRSIEFHAHRGDFSNWVRDALHDGELARELKDNIDKGFHGEELRNIVYDLVKRRHDELVKIATSSP